MRAISEKSMDAPNAPPRPKPGLLVVDDEAGILSAMRRFLRTQPYPVLTSQSPLEGLAILEREHIGVVISDYKMKEMDGVQLLTRVKERWPKIQRIMLTGEADYNAIEDVINRSQVFRFISKPWDPQALLLTISASFEQYQVLCENERLWELTRSQNETLKDLNRDLEAKVGRRTNQLARAKVEWERTFDAIVDPLAVVRDDYVVLRANLAYAKQGGLEIRDVPGRKCHETLAGRDQPCLGCPLHGALTGEPKGRVTIHAKQGKVLDVWAFPLHLPHGSDIDMPIESGELFALRTALADGITRASEPPAFHKASLPTGVCFYRDVTEERVLQEKLARTQKLASLGFFAGGVAHQIRNPLASILAHTQLLLRALPATGEVTESLKDIEASAQDCNRIIESLRNFADPTPVFHAERIDTRGLLEAALREFRRGAGAREGITAEIAVDPATPPVVGDPALLVQVFRNLLDNAAQHGMAEGGKLEVRLSARPTDWRDMLGRSIRGVELWVSDNGKGIAESHRAKVFDPFFTTKMDRKGTGLGLSICHRVVEQHDGSIGVESVVGQGTTFRIVLPAAMENA